MKRYKRQIFYVSPEWRNYYLPLLEEKKRSRSEMKNRSALFRNSEHWEKDDMLSRQADYVLSNYESVDLIDEMLMDLTS